MKVKAVLFDLDGTLRDTESIIFNSLKHTLSSHGVAMPSREELSPYLHHHNFVHEKFVGHVSREDFDEVYYAHKNMLMTNVELFDEVREMLEELRKKYKLGLVTAARSSDLDLEQLGLADVFDVIIGGDMLTAHKPHPEGINMALEKLDITPNEAVYVGDMPTDVEAGKAAQLLAIIGVSYGFMTVQELLDAGARVVVDKPHELLQAIKEIE